MLLIVLIEQHLFDITEESFVSKHRHGCISRCTDVLRCVTSWIDSEIQWGLTE